jgi:phosphoglucosamine mutase
VVSTDVGDRYVLEALRAGGFNLGGEQSGHLLLLEHSTTGDGVLTALQLLAQAAADRRTLGELASVVTRLPQVLVNVKGVDKARVDDKALLSAVEAAEAELGESGRVLLRPSGTEPVVRVMVEAVEVQQAEEIASRLANVVRQTLG